MFSSQELKLKYYTLMVEMSQHEHSYLAICQYYQAIFDTPQVQENEAHWKDVSVVIKFGTCVACYEWLR